MAEVTCDRCLEIKTGVRFVRFNDEVNAVPNMGLNGGRMCRKCRNLYSDLIYLPMYAAGGCQFPKYQRLINEYEVLQINAEILNEQNADLTGDEIPIHIILPPDLSYYGIPIKFH